MDFTEQDYENMAIQAIRKYLNKDFSDDNIKQNFKYAMNRIINKAKQLDASKPVGVKSFNAGSISMTFDNTTQFAIDDEIKALLPTPYIKMC